MSRQRAAILISGRGSNMAALIRAAKAPDYPAEIVGVFSNNPDAEGLEAAAADGIPVAALSQKGMARQAFEAAMETILIPWRPKFLCLAGFMRILSEDFVRRWTGRIINIHPSLLPRYRGLNTHERALAEGATEHGCTVHFVTPGLDEGPPILQARVPILAHDTPEALAARVLAAEHRLYPEALAMLARGEASLGVD
jgi:phosphoribosylglycinamide formyltransferase-1